MFGFKHFIKKKIPRSPEDKAKGDKLMHDLHHSKGQFDKADEMSAWDYMQRHENPKFYDDVQDIADTYTKKMGVKDPQAERKKQWKIRDYDE